MMKTFDLIIKCNASGNYIKPMNGGFLNKPVFGPPSQDIKSVTVGNIVYRYEGSSYAPNEKPYLDWIEARRKAAKVEG